MTDEEQKLLKTAMDTAAPAVDDEVTLVVNQGVVIILIAQLQLALRHPGNTGLGADITRELIMQLIGLLPEGLHEFMMRGFDPGCDV